MSVAVGAVRVTVATARPYDVVIGPGVLAQAERATAGASDVVVVTDTNAARHVERLAALAGGAPIVLAPGERTKSFAELEALLERLAERTLDRRACLVALGGGVIGDLAGLAASLYMRGINVVQCPTTLVAQVDAAVGGKTAIDLRAGKNLAGTFWQPRAVLADVETLATLPDAELASGLGEALKSALVGDEELLSLLERESARIRARDPALLARIVERAVRVKAAIVVADEREGGRATPGRPAAAADRRALNLGHTFAHAIEHVAGYGAIPHGVAVGVGLALALAAAETSGILADRGLPARVARLLPALGLCPDLAALRAAYGARLPPAELAAALTHDKKAARGRPAFVLPRAVGALVTDAELPPALVTALLA